MKVIVGLGNPGEKYERNRHNVGFMMIDYILRHPELVSGSDEQRAQKLHSEIWEKNINNTKYLLVKPQTFMNSSGEAVLKIMSFYKVKPEDIIVIHDDLDLKLGEYKISKKGPKIHNGILSIEQHIGLDFTRVRIGVDNRNPDNRLPGDVYVLSNFEKNEISIVHEVFEKIFNDLFQ